MNDWPDGFEERPLSDHPFAQQEQEPMNGDTDLANAVVELGIINGDVDLVHDGGYVYWIGNDVHDIYSASEIVRDPRVAMAVALKCIKEDKYLRTVMLSYHPTMGVFEASLAKSAVPVYGTYLDRSDEDPFRAITEAAVQALKE